MMTTCGWCGERLPTHVEMDVMTWDGCPFCADDDAGKPHTVPGDVVEVKYLYAVHPDSPRLTQPTLLRVRSDKSPQECLSDQLHYTSKTVIDSLA